MTAPWLKTLDEVEGSDLPLVGSKTFNLASLRRHGLPVLPGLVVTTAFFQAQLRHCQVVPLWAGSPDVAVTEDALCGLADTLKTSPLSPELRVALQTRLSDTFPDTEVFAVRSSAIDEDTHQYAFSGIHLTELGVPPDMVPLSIARCWASALSKEALEYRRRHGISIQSIRVAVLIQPFIRSTVAGVAFTVNPVSGAQDEMLIEAVHGQAKVVVEGKVTPVRYRLSKHAPDYTLLDWTPGASRGTEILRNTGLIQAGVDECSPLPSRNLRELAAYLEQI